jgi:hypothetical protein
MHPFIIRIYVLYILSWTCFIMQSPFPTALSVLGLFSSSDYSAGRPLADFLHLFTINTQFRFPARPADYCRIGGLSLPEIVLDQAGVLGNSPGNECDSQRHWRQFRSPQIASPTRFRTILQVSRPIALFPILYSLAPYTLTALLSLSASSSLSSVSD